MVNKAILNKYCILRPIIKINIGLIHFGKIEIQLVIVMVICIINKEKL